MEKLTNTMRKAIARRSRTFKTVLLLLALACVSQARSGVVTRDVEYELDGTKLKGFLAYEESLPPDPKRPGVLVVPEWWGLNDFAKGRARQLAEMGYVAFAADMYGGGENTTDAKQAKAWAGSLYGSPLMAARARAGLDQLLKTGRVDEKKVAAIGFCFGGTTCLALAYSGAPLAGIVSFHGGLIQPSPGDLKKIRARLLILNGAVDPTVKPEAAALFMKALDSGGIDYRFINYSGALHAFTNPEATRLAEQNGMTGVIGYNENAARRSWAEMQLFFDELFHDHPANP